MSKASTSNNNSSTSTLLSSEEIPNNENNQLTDEEFIASLQTLVNNSSTEPELKEIYQGLIDLFNMIPEIDDNDSDENSDEESSNSTTSTIDRSKPKLKRFADKIFVSIFIIIIF